MKKYYEEYKGRIPASYPDIGAYERQTLDQVVKKGWFTEGKFHKQFARDLSDFTGQKFVELCNSGSSADLLAVAALSPYEQKNKYVITCAVGFPTTLTAIYHNNLIPLYVDIDPKTLSPSMGHIEYALNHPEYKDDIVGAVLTHNLGFPFEEKLVKQLLGDKWLIADCCDALGAEFIDIVNLNDGEDRIPHVGHYADISTYSFFPAHHITTGEGGAVCTNNGALFDTIRSLNNWGRDCWCAPGQQNICGKRFDHDFPGLPRGWDHKYTFTNVGYNLKMTELQAAIGVAQMQKIIPLLETRLKNYGKITKILRKYSDFVYSVEPLEHAFISPFGVPITVMPNNLFDATDLILFLEKRRINTRRLFGGNLKMQPAFSKLPYASVEFEGADFVMHNTFWIGCHAMITPKDIDYIENVFEEWFYGIQK